MTVFTFRHNLLDCVKESESEYTLPDGGNDDYRASNGLALPTAAVRKANAVCADIWDRTQDYYTSQEYKNGKGFVKTVSQFFDENVSQAREELKNEGHNADFLEAFNLTCNNDKLGLASYAGDDVDGLSLALYGSSVELQGGDLEGLDLLSRVIDTLSTPLPERIKYEHKVTGIKYDNDGVSVTAAVHGQEDVVISADYVICTMPLGVLKKEHQSIFMPPLPESKVETELAQP